MVARPEPKRGDPRCRTHRHGWGAAGAGAGSQGGGVASEAGWFPWPHHACLSFFSSFFFYEKKKKSFSSHPKLPGRTQPGQWEPPRSAQPMEPAGRVRPVGPPRKDKLWGSWGDTGTPASQHPLCPKRPRCQQEIGEGRQLGEGVRPRHAARPPSSLAKRLRASVFPSGEWAQGWGVTPAVPRGVTASPVPWR